MKDQGGIGQVQGPKGSDFELEKGFMDSDGVIQVQLDNDSISDNREMRFLHLKNRVELVSMSSSPSCP